jgi:hypothetical protein
MKILFLSLAVISSFCATAQQKSTGTKSSTNPVNTTKSSSNAQLNQQYDNANVTVVNKNEELRNSNNIEEKYKFIINQNSSRIKEVEDKLSAKSSEYNKVDKLKNNKTLSSDIDKSIYGMLSEFLGKDATDYYLKHKKSN